MKYVTIISFLMLCQMQTLFSQLEVPNLLKVSVLIDVVVVEWTPIENESLTAYNIYRLGDNGFEVIATVSGADPALFFDYEAAPDMASESYTISATDDQGAETSLSPDIHTTIYCFSDYECGDEALSFNWNNYTNYMIDHFRFFSYGALIDSVSASEFDLENLFYLYDLTGEEQVCFTVAAWVNGLGLSNSNEYCVDVCNDVGIQSLEEFGVSVTQNLVHNELVIQSSDNNEGTIFVYDSYGRLMKESALQNVERIETHLWPAGVYIVSTVNSLGQVYSSRIVKQ